ncbi:unnamed protein product [Protopolystoma xenopodis]|uniref:Uncharacterized protein n=1 Tax=Protopolystoma xenopodis TaxID=117903 RepID=A0A448WAN3_9PLAT|nr:unnamed protein product [Protopolystoma xenopodis]
MCAEGKYNLYNYAGSNGYFMQLPSSSFSPPHALFSIETGQPILTEYRSGLHFGAGEGYRERHAMMFNNGQIILPRLLGFG